jgi:simple sugar transport system substrate-binding protein
MDDQLAAFPDDVSVTTSFDITFDTKTTQLVEHALAAGANMVVDTSGAGKFITDACDQYPDVPCFVAGDPAKPGPSVRSYYVKQWQLDYLAGMAAGLMTETGELGMIGAYDIPLVNAVVNAYALGCQRVRPDCTVRLIYTDDYYDPPKDVQATNALIDAGADVIRSYNNDQSYCREAQRRGALAVVDFGEYDGCPKALIVSTPFAYGAYIVEQTQQILDGTWKGGGRDFVNIGTEDDEPRLGQWGTFVPSSVRQEVEAVRDQMVVGKDVIAGPIYDQAGQLQFAEGEVPSDEFLLFKWQWLVQGVISSAN